MNPRTRLLQMVFTLLKWHVSMSVACSRSFGTQNLRSVVKTMILFAYLKLNFAILDTFDILNFRLVSSMSRKKANQDRVALLCWLRSLFLRIFQY